MKEITLKDFSAGNMPNVDSRSIPDNALSSSHDCYVDNTGNIVSREKLDMITTNQSDWSGNLQSLITSLKISKVHKWEYSIIPNNTEISFGFIAWSETDLKVYYLYYDKGTTQWVRYGSSHIFSSIQEPYFAPVYSGVMFVDGRDNNNAKIMFIDSDRNFATTSVKNYSSNKIIDSDVTSYETADINSSITGTGEIAGSIVQYVYTILLKDGTETNPSPIYSGDFYQFIHKNPDTFDYDEYIKKLKLTDITVPDDIQSNAEKIRIYRRTSLFTEQAPDLGTFVYVKEFDLNGVFAGISIVDSSPATDKEVNYDSASDLAGDDICQVNNTVFVANARSKPSFPVTLKNWYKIAITVNEQYNHVDAKICLSSSCLIDFIEPSEWADFFLTSQWQKRLRFYHYDTITPLVCAVNKTGDFNDGYSENIPVFYLRLPDMPASGSYVLYMGISPLVTDPSISDTSYEYGYPEDLALSYDVGEYLYKGRRVLNTNNLVVVNMENGGIGNYDYIGENRSDGKFLELHKDGSDADNYIYPINSNFVGENYLNIIEKSRLEELSFGYFGLAGVSLKVREYSGNKYYFKEKEMPVFFPEDADERKETLVFGCTISLDEFTVPDTNTNVIYELCGYNTNNVYSGTSKFYGVSLGLKLRRNGNIYSYSLCLIYRPDGSSDNINYIDLYTEDSRTITSLTGKKIIFNIAVSYHNNQDHGEDGNIYAISAISYFDGSSYSHTYKFTTLIADDLLEVASNEDQKQAYYIGCPRDDYYGGIPVSGNLKWIPFECNYLSWHCGYYTNDFEVLHNMLFNLSSFDLGTLSTSGAYFDGDKTTLDQVGATANIYSLDFDQNNFLRWSTANGYSFPLSNTIKLPEPAVAIIPAPSFLQQYYQNTIFVFSENKITRILLSDKDGSPVVEKNILEEQNKFGIKDRNSLVSIKNTFLWNSNSGICSYSPDQSAPQLISSTQFDSVANIRNIVDTKNEMVWFYQDNYFNVIYVYDYARGVWWKFLLEEVPTAKFSKCYSYFNENGYLYMIAKTVESELDKYRLVKQTASKVDSILCSMTTKKFSSRELFGNITTSLRQCYVDFDKTNSTPTNTVFTTSGSSPNFTSDITTTTNITTTVEKKEPLPPSVVYDYFKITIDNFGKIRLINLRGK